MTGKQPAEADVYKAAGVDISAGEALVAKIRPLVQATQGPAVRGEYGGYGALYSLQELGAPGTLLVTSTDGVGTKLQLTTETGYWDRIGQDLVAMCANDILCLGARPLFFLDYYATGELDVDCTAQIIQGLAQACQSIGCALLGGETAEMPGVYRPGDFDMAGFIVGAVQEDQVIDGKKIQVGDRVLGLASSGFHSNGYSLIRRIIQEQQLDMEQEVPGTTDRVGDLLTVATRLYGPSLQPLLSDPACHGLAHITGGGLVGNLPRILPESGQIRLDRSRWQRPPIIEFVAEIGTVAANDMVRVFNDGIGMVVIVDAAAAERITSQLEAAGETVWDLGLVEARPSNEAGVILL